MARGERRRHGVEGVGERGGDAVLLEVGGADLDVAVVSLQPGMVVWSDAVAEHVDGLRLVAEADRQLLGDEHIGALRDGEHAGDRVVICDGDEVHTAPFGELVDLGGFSRAFGERERALDAELGELRGARVHVHVHACHLGSHGVQLGRMQGFSRERAGDGV